MGQTVTAVGSFIKELGNDSLATRVANAISKHLACYSLKELREYREGVGDQEFKWSLGDVPWLGEKGRARLDAVLSEQWFPHQKEEKLVGDTEITLRDKRGYELRNLHIQQADDGTILRVRVGAGAYGEFDHQEVQRLHEFLGAWLEGEL